MVIPSACASQASIRPNSSASSSPPLSAAQVSAEMQPGQRMEQPWNQIPSRRPGPKRRHGKMHARDGDPHACTSRSSSCVIFPDLIAEMTARPPRFSTAVEQCARQGIDQMRLDLVADTAPAVRQIRKAKLAQLQSRIVADLDVDVLTGDVLERARQHGFEDLRGNAVPDEVKHDDVLAHPVQKLRPVDDLLEVPVDLAPDLLLDARVVIGRGDVQHALAAAR